MEHIKRNVSKVRIIAGAGIALMVISWTSIDTQGRIFSNDSIEAEESPLTIIKSREDTLTFDADNDQQLDPGDRVKYVLAFENSGTKEVTNVVIEDDYDESLVTISQISDEGKDDTDKITWTIDTLLPGEGGEFNYIVTLKPMLEVGNYTVSNIAKIYGDEIEPVEVAIKHEVNIEATPVPTGTQTPSHTASPVVPTPSLTSVPPQPRTVGASLPTDQPVFYVIMGTLIGILELGGLVVIAFISKQGVFAEHERSRVVRVAIVVTMVIGAVLVMGLFGGIERGAAAGILGTIAGYLLRGIREE